MCTKTNIFATVFIFVYMVAIATKMEQIAACVNTLLHLIGDVPHLSVAREMAEYNFETLRSLPGAAGKMVKYGGNEGIEWTRGDRPSFHGSNIRIGLPTVLVNGGTFIPERFVRRPDFEAVEFCCILHVSADSRMTLARAQLMKPRTRNELGSDLIGPWTDHIAMLFND